MVADAMHAKSISIEPTDRDWMRSQSLPPINWQIWIGAYEGELWRDLAMQHHSGILHLAAVSDPDTLSGYISATTFGIGRLLALVLGTSIVGLDIDIGIANEMLRRI